MNSDVNVLMVLFLIGFVFYTLAKFGLLKNTSFIFLSRDEKWKLKNFFSKHLHYFNKLSEKEKDLFIVRSYKLSRTLNIIGRQGFIITNEVKLFVAAAQVQLTLGFKQYFLSKFHTILIYPDAYQNKITGNMHYGEVNPKGIIVLSWKRFLKGYEIPDDKINLGLHEMAHALMHTIIHSYDHENGLDKYLREIVRLSRDEMEKIKSDDHHFFRHYASTNIYEFFAVAVEYFFEVPKELKKELPMLYQYMLKLLKQEPS